MLRLAALACFASALAAADLQSLSWLAGRWTSEEKGALSEEMWSPPAGDSMMGAWRMVADGKTRIYELLVFKQEASGLVLLLRHFDPALGVRASEKDGPLRFELKSSDGKWVFEAVENGKSIGLTYSRPAPDTLQVTLTKDGKAQAFTMRRTN
jgi:hypothetical protein